jgi:hypothetical protein
MGSLRPLLMRLRSHPVAALVAAAVVIGGAGGGVVAATGGTAASTTPVTVTVGSTAVSQPVSPGFVGLSLEVRGVESLTGTDPHNVNPVLEQLIRNLSPGSRPTIRLGGDTADWSWYPIPGHGRPLGVRYDLSKTWLAVVRALAAATNAQLIAAVNFEVDSTSVAGAEAHALASGLGPYLHELALGNEPELYAGIPWFIINHKRYYGRTQPWTFSRFISDYSKLAGALPRNIPLAGPDMGGPVWEPELGAFLSAEPRVRTATIHRYPLKQCTPTPKATIPELLSQGATSGLAAGLKNLIHMAHAHHVAFRLDETNSVSCGGEPGVSNTFASSLWALDEMFQLAKAGVDGVNVHSKLGTANALWVFSQSGTHWSGYVTPDYYGLLAFAQAAPTGAQLLKVTGAGWPIDVFATRASDGTERVVMVNLSAGRSYAVTVHAGPGTATGALARLTAPSLGATGHVTLGGQSFGAHTSSGLLGGTPQTTPVSPSHGAYKVSVPAASAAILTLPAH